MKRMKSKMYYGYRMTEDGWTRMKTFDTIQEYKEYVEKRKVVWGLCSSEPVDLRGEAASEKYMARMYKTDAK